MYKEYSLCFPRYDLVEEDEDSIVSFRKLLAIMEIEIDLNWLSNHLYDNFILGEGDIYVFHNSTDMESFLLLDCFCYETDQLDTAMVELRVSEEKSALVRAALEELRLTFWGRNDCLVRENYNDELKIKSITYNNFTIENERKKSIAWRKYLESEVKVIFIGNKETKKSKIHQPIIHNLNGEIIEVAPQNRKVGIFDYKIHYYYLKKSVIDTLKIFQKKKR